MGQNSNELIQIETNHVLNSQNANEQLRIFQKVFPKREIIGVSMVPADPAGWFMTITYKVSY